MQRRIQRAFFDLDELFGSGIHVSGNPKTMIRRAFERLQYQKFQAALQVVIAFCHMLYAQSPGLDL
jgi:hypothetical protein